MITRFPTQADVQDLNLRCGDLVAFLGQEFLSKAIGFFTRSRVSHVGTMVDSKQLAESTTLNGRRGAQINLLSERVRDYKGCVWILPLSEEARTYLNEERFINFLLSTVGRKYDYRQVLHFGVDLLHLIPSRESISRLFCSEWVAGAYEASGLIGAVNASDFRPIDVVKLGIFTYRYYQVQGDAKGIL